MSEGQLQALRRAKAAFDAGALDEAEQVMRAVLAEGSAEAADTLGAVCLLTNRVEEGVRLILKTLERRPTAVAPRYNLGLAFLKLGYHDLGWVLMEARRGIPEMKAPNPAFPFPEWRGEPLAGKRLVVMGEQGAGDQIMFARYFRLVEAKGAKVTFLSDANLVTLLPNAMQSVPRLFPADYWTPILSLPFRLGAGGHIPEPARLAVPLGGGGGVGVMTSGRASYSNDRNRSLFGIDAERLLRLGRSLAPEETGAADFLETARIVAELDLVITVDTSVAHLAGSLGKPVWILLPRHGTDWRWGLEGETTPWYPTARLYRQAEAGRWGPVLDRIEADLAELGLS